MSRLPFGDLPKNLNQAIDLSSLGKPKVEAPIIGVEVTQQSLVQELIPASMTQPVFIICWSPRSTQSRELVTMMGELHSSDAGWILATLDVDAHQNVAQALGIQAIPFALALIQEQPVPLFESIPPREQVKTLITKVLEAAAKRGVGKAPEVSEEEAPMDPEEVAALDAISKGDMAGAKQAYLNWLQRVPGNTLAEIGLAQVELLIRIEGVDAQSAISSAIAGDLKSQTIAADIEIAMGQYQDAFNRMISLIRSGDADIKTGARAHLLELFKLVDPNDPVLIQARRDLASALF